MTEDQFRQVLERIASRVDSDEYGRRYPNFPQMSPSDLFVLTNLFATGKLDEYWARCDRDVNIWDHWLVDQGLSGSSAVHVWWAVKYVKQTNNK